MNSNTPKKAMVIAPHPDDAEIGMGGTIAKMVSGGWTVIIVDLTDGEPTPFGTKEIRAKETALATQILGVQHRICLDMPNRYLEATLDNRRKLAETIREFQPDVLFGPCMPDWHPDHVAATQILEAARFEAKYHKTDMKGQPHWTPALYYYYSPHRLDYQKSSFVVDISKFWEKKKAAISAFESQLKNQAVNQPHSLIDKCEVVSRYFGCNINTLYGEPFISNDPLKMESF